MFGMTVRNQNRGLDLYDPFRQMEALEQAFFGEPFGRFFAAPAFEGFRTDITDEGDHYLLETDLPGFDKKDIRLEILGDTLTLQAERRSRQEKKDKADKVIRQERSYGAYTRQFDLSNVEAEGIQAQYENGVLRLTLPKKEKKQPKSRQINID